MIDKRAADSAEMQKNIAVVKKMSSGMGFDENMDSINWKSIRFISNIGYMFMPKEKGITCKKRILNHRKCMVAAPKQESASYIILYIHGGGFVSGSSASSKGYCSMLAKYGECKVVSVDYSLSPEHKYPVALNDCVEVYAELTRQYPDSSIVLVGESAGASLCLTACHKILAEKLKKPCCLIVHSPFVDFSGSLDRTIHTIDDFTVKEGCLKPLQSIYAGKRLGQGHRKRCKSYERISNLSERMRDEKNAGNEGRCRNMSSLLKSTLNTRPLMKDSYRYIRSDVPYQLTEDEITFLIENDITTLIDLRTVEEIKRKPVPVQAHSAFTYLHMPVSGGDIVPDSQDSVSESYLNMVDAQMNSILSCIENAESNVLFFCNAGKDRTGVVSALLMKRLGFTDEEIIADYLLSANNLGALLNSYAESQNIDVTIITPQKRYMEEFLKGIS